MPASRRAGVFTHRLWWLSSESMTGRPPEASSSRSRTAELLSSDISVLAHEPPVIQASGGQSRCSRAHPLEDLVDAERDTERELEQVGHPGDRMVVVHVDEARVDRGAGQVAHRRAVVAMGEHVVLRADGEHTTARIASAAANGCARFAVRTAPPVRIRSAATVQRSSGRAGSYSTGCTVVESSRPCAPNVKWVGPCPASPSPNSTPCARSDFWSR